LSIKNSIDVSSIKTVAFNGDILPTCSIPNIFANFENNWNRFGLVTIGIIEIADFGFSILNSSITSLKHHGDVLTVGNSSFTNLTSGGIHFPVCERGFRINSIFEIDEISTNSGIDEWKLITVEIFDKGHGIMGIEPYLSN